MDRAEGDLVVMVAVVGSQTLQTASRRGAPVEGNKLAV